jgi:photosystem II stability/assembly factor-like uncharacterized protein
MRTALPAAIASAAALMALLGLESAPPVPDAPRPALPPPTDGWLDPATKDLQKQRRKAWWREMHRAPDGVDWQAIERENGLAQIAKRSALARQRRSGEPPEDPLSGGAWVERGSENQAGRVHVARHSVDGDTLYVGSSLGGLWMGAADGSSWTPIGDNLYGGVHWLEVLPAESSGDPDVLLVATDGGLVHRSLDRGASWEAPEGLGSPTGVRRLLMATDGSLELFMVVNDADGTAALWRSRDRGASFEEVYDLGGFYGDAWAPRDGGGGLYLLADGELLLSEDGGDSWSSAGELPDAGRGELAGSEAGAPRFWAVLDSVTLLRSDDAGGRWLELGDVSDYWSALNASITDPDLFAWGGVELHVTENAGASFEIVNYWWEYYDSPADTLHADIMGIDVVPDGDGEIWYVDTDGGLFRSEDGLRTVENLALSGLRISQYYDVLTSTVNPDNVAAGAQDQGYQITNGLPQDDGVFEFSQIISGDYGSMTSTDGSHALLYSAYPGFILIQVGDEAPYLLSADFPGGESGEYYGWIPPMLADPLDPEGFFFGATRLYYYARASENRWIPELWSEQDFNRDSYEYIAAIVASPLDPERMWVTSSYGRLYASADRGVTWTESYSRGSWYASGLVASGTDVDTLYVGGSGYGGAHSVYRSTDGGVSLEPFDDGMPETHVYTLAEAPDGSGVLFAGTTTAVYRRDPGDEAWTDITGDAAPVTAYFNVEPLQHENTMRFATYGRGVWDYQLDPDYTGCFPVQDRDGDGVDCESDCEDGDAAVYPGAEEVCDGVDSNCDPEDLDEADLDLDGAFACEDCDDADPDAFPGAEEICGDGVDQDCDGEDAECPPEEEPPEDTDPPQQDTESPDDPAVEEEDTAPEAKGCGCSAPLGAPGAAWLVLVPLAAALRRRRS